MSADLTVGGSRIESSQASDGEKEYIETCLED